MKKIVFVQKQESIYDPVTAFFGRKAPSQSKSINTATQITNSKQNIDKKLATGTNFNQKKSTAQSKIQEATPKLPKRANNISTNNKPYPTKQQILKTRDLSRTNIKPQFKTSSTKILDEKPLFSQQSEEPKKQKQDSLQKMKEQVIMKPIQKVEAKQQVTKGDGLNKKIKDFQLRQQEYIAKIQELQAKQEKYIKNQQKLAKLQKDFKLAVQKNKDIQKSTGQLKEKEQMIKQMLQGNSIPFSKKREVILTNKINELKRINRQLVMRLKNYKGTDLVQLSIQQNREQIMKDLYTVDVQKQLNQEMHLQMEALTNQLSQTINSYLQRRIKEKGQKLVWVDEQSFLTEIINLSEKISLNFLNKYQICPIPKSNEQAKSAYSILQQYKKKEGMQKIIDRFSLNTILSQQNSQIINQVQQTQDKLCLLKDEITKPKRKKQIVDKNRFNQFLQIYEKRSTFTQILLIQNIWQVQMIKQWIQKVHSKVIDQVNSISKYITEIKDIVFLGEAGKQSLYYYLSTNIGLLQAKFPSLKLKLKQINCSFSNIQKLMQPK